MRRWGAADGRKEVSAAACWASQARCALHTKRPHTLPQQLLDAVRCRTARDGAQLGAGNALAAAVLDAAAPVGQSPRCTWGPVSALECPPSLCERFNAASARAASPGSRWRPHSGRHLRAPLLAANFSLHASAT